MLNLPMVGVLDLNERITNTNGANERPRVDAGWRVLFALARAQPRATQAEH